MNQRVKEKYLYTRPQLCLYRGVILENLSSNDFDNIRNFTISKHINEVETMSFEIPFSDYRKIDYNNSELLIKFENDYYIIKDISITSNTNGIIKVTALREQEELKTCYCEPIDLIGATPKEMFDEIKKTTLHSSSLNYYWKGTDVESSKRRQLQCAEEQSVYENLIAMAKVFNGWLEFSTDEDGVNWIFLRTQSIVSGKHVKKNLDMKELNITYNSDEIFTRLIAYGNVVDLSGHELNIMEVNPTGKEYVENYDYYLSMGVPKEIIDKEPKYQKIKILRDDKYVDAKDLYEFALEEIKKCSQPKLEASIVISDDSIFEDSLEIPPMIGYEINCIDSEIGFILSCRIDGVERNYDNPSEVKVEISNFLAYDTVFQNIQHSANEADKNGSKLPIINEELSSTIENLKATNIEVKNLYVTKAEIIDLKATNANIDNLTANVAKIDTLVNGNLTSDNIHSLILSSDKVTVENGFVKNAMIDNLDVSKINAGTISTDKFNITSKNGGISIVGATQQFKDKNNKVRIQMGQDTQGNFNFVLRAEDGTTTLIDGYGVKEKAIADNLIKSNMISENAVGEKQLNYSSFTQGFNKLTNNNFLNASKVNVDLTGQTLELSFKNLDTSVKGIGDKTNSNLTEIKAIQGKITTLISNTTIIKDGQTTQLKDEYNATVLEVDKMKNTISVHESKFNNDNKAINEVKDKTNTLERNLNETKNTLIETNKTLNSNTTKISEVNISLDKFIARISSVEEKNNQLYVNLDKVEKSLVSTINSEINVLKNSIKLKLNETTFITLTKNTNGKIETLTNKTNTNSSEINILKNSIQLKVEQNQIDNAINNLKSSINLDFDGIRSEVTTLKTDNSNNKQNIIDANTKITQLSNQISSSVTKDNIGTLITQNYDSVSIAIANKTNSSVVIDSDGLTINDGKFRINKDGEKYLSIGNNGSVNSRRGYSVFDSDGTEKLCMSRDGIDFSYDESGSVNIKATSRRRIEVSKSLRINDSLDVSGDLEVGDEDNADSSVYMYGECIVYGDFRVKRGDKNCIQETKNYGDREIYAYETAESYFGDIGNGIIKDGECVVEIDNIFSECVNTNIDYCVFTQAYKGKINTIKRYSTYFIVYGEDDTEFCWELKAKRLGKENNRLNSYTTNKRDEYIVNEDIFFNEINELENDNTLENLLLKTK